MYGVIRTINEVKYYAFITTNFDDRSNDYFFHKSDFEGHWDDLVSDFNNKLLGAIKVEFEPVKSEKGPRAKSVKRIDFPNEG